MRIHQLVEDKQWVTYSFTITGYRFGRYSTDAIVHAAVLMLESRGFRIPDARIGLSPVSVDTVGKVGAQVTITGTMAFTEECYTLNRTFGVAIWRPEIGDWDNYSLRFEKPLGESRSTMVPTDLEIHASGNVIKDPVGNIPIDAQELADHVIGMIRARGYGVEEVGVPEYSTHTRRDFVRVRVNIDISVFTEHGTMDNGQFILNNWNDANDCNHGPFGSIYVNGIMIPSVISRKISELAGISYGCRNPDQWIKGIL